MLCFFNRQILGIAGGIIIFYILPELIIPILVLGVVKDRDIIIYNIKK